MEILLGVAISADGGKQILSAHPLAERRVCRRPNNQPDVEPLATARASLDRAAQRRYAPTNLVCGLGMPAGNDDLRHGSLDLLVLKAVSWSAMHGYAIAKWIQDRAGAEFPVIDAALYKALHRLEEDGALHSEWGHSDNNRRAKYYSLTARGRQRLRSEVAGWRRYAAAINAVLETT